MLVIDFSTSWIEQTSFVVHNHDVFFCISCYVSVIWIWQPAPSLVQFQIFLEPFLWKRKASPSTDPANGREQSQDERFATRKFCHADSLP